MRLQPLSSCCTLNACRPSAPRPRTGAARCVATGSGCAAGNCACHVVAWMRRRCHSHCAAGSSRGTLRTPGGWSRVATGSRLVLGLSSAAVRAPPARQGHQHACTCGGGGDASTRRPQERSPGCNVARCGGAWQRPCEAGRASPHDKGWPRQRSLHGTARRSERVVAALAVSRGTGRDQAHALDVHRISWSAPGLKDADFHQRAAPGTLRVCPRHGATVPPGVVRGRSHGRSLHAARLVPRGGRHHRKGAQCGCHRLQADSRVTRRIVSPCAVGGGVASVHRVFLPCGRAQAHLIEHIIRLFASESGRRRLLWSPALAARPQRQAALPSAFCEPADSTVGRQR